MNDKTRYLIKKLRLQVAICFILIVLTGITTLLFDFDIFNKDAIQIEEITLGPIVSEYDIIQLDNTKGNLDIKFGYELFINTPKYIGPDNGNPDMVYSGNRLACNNCHLQAGTKPFSAPLIGIVNRFPQFRGRENKIGTIMERINGCMEQSMNGRTLPSNGKEMQAFIYYLTWLSRFTPDDGKVVGQGFLKIKIPNRAVSLEKGEQIFETNCALCHGKTGQGFKIPESFTYQYPPLWGKDSYNNGAGMTRVITSARFIKANMPYGSTFDNPLLSDEEAYDVAGYINQQQRPEKRNLKADFPDLTKKPVSTPYGPYTDNFPIVQHQIGPFQPIMDFYKNEFNIIKSK